MLVVTETGNLIFTDSIGEVYVERYKNGTYCVRASLIRSEERMLVKGISRSEAEEAKFAIADAVMMGKPVVNFSRDYEERINRKYLCGGPQVKETATS